MILISAAKRYWRFLGVLSAISGIVVGVLDVTNAVVGGGTNTFGSAFYSVDLSLAAPLVSGYYVHILPMPARNGVRLVEGLWRGTRAFPAVFVAELIVTVGIGLGFLAFVVPGLVLAVRWCVVAPCVSVKPNPWKMWYRGIGESVRLTADSFWYVFRVMACVVLIAAVLSLGVETISTTKTARDIFAVAVQILSVSFGGTVLTVLYVDLLNSASDGRQ